MSGVSFAPPQRGGLLAPSIESLSTSRHRSVTRQGKEQGLRSGDAQYWSCLLPGAEAAALKETKLLPGSKHWQLPHRKIKKAKQQSPSQVFRVAKYQKLRWDGHAMSPAWSSWGCLSVAHLVMSCWLDTGPGLCCSPTSLIPSFLWLQEMQVKPGWENCRVLGKIISAPGHFPSKAHLVPGVSQPSPVAWDLKEGGLRKPMEQIRWTEPNFLAESISVNVAQP